MGRYLNEFLSVVPAIQGKQILEILNTARDTGQIRTLEEYQAKLQELTQVLQSTDPQPTLRLIQAIVGKQISSEAFNLMINSSLNDLKTAFKEIKNISEVLEIHKILINDNILNNLKFAIIDLENKIAIQEFLNNDRNGFTKALFNTFRQNQTLSTKRSDVVASDTYIDNQTGRPIGANFDATVDIIGEKLIMSPKRTKFITIRQAKQLFDAETRITELNVEFPGSSIRNMIDNQTGSYWVYPTLLGAPDNSGVISKIELELSGYQDVNFLEIEPATLSSFVLEKIIYLDVNAENQTLDVDPILINNKRRLDFNVITTRKLTFHFRQRNYKNVQYSYNQNTRIWERAIATDQITLNDFDKTLLNDELLNILNSEELRDLNDITEPTAYSNVNMYEYLIGFDNIRVGFTQYDDRSIFVSSVLSGNQIGILGLKTLENRLLDLSDIPISSFEYTIFKQNFASDGSLVDSEKFNILPVSELNILHERLLLTETTALNNDTGTLRFYPDGSVIIYKDFSITPLTPVIDYLIIDNGSLTPKEYKIQLVSPNPTSIYTISYNPEYSGNISGTEIWLTKQKTAKLNVGNIIEFTNTRPNAIVSSSDIYLTILFRNNSTLDTETPTIEEYKLLIGTINIQRFIG